MESFKLRLVGLNRSVEVTICSNSNFDYLKKALASFQNFIYNINDKTINIISTVVSLRAIYIFFTNTYSNNISDWLTNYSFGYVRRGFAGTILLGLSNNLNFGPYNLTGAMARSILPSKISSRLIPNIDRILSNNLTQQNPSINSAWETVPLVERTMNWGLTVRRQINSVNQIAQDRIKISALAFFCS